MARADPIRLKRLAIIAACTVVVLGVVGYAVSMKSSPVSKAEAGLITSEMTLDEIRQKLSSSLREGTSLAESSVALRLHGFDVGDVDESGVLRAILRFPREPMAMTSRAVSVQVRFDVNDRLVEIQVQESFTGP